jgi:hypothetical protein
MLLRTTWLVEGVSRRLFVRSLGTRQGKAKQAPQSRDVVSELSSVAQKRAKKEQAESEEVFEMIKAAVKVDRMNIKFSEAEAAEHAKIGAKYNYETSRESADELKDLATKCWLQQEAIKAIPYEALREAAEIIDEEPPPMHRPYPVFSTPPIEGFDVNDWDGSKNFGKNNDADDEDDDESNF